MDWTRFFMLCTLINGGLLLFWTLMLLACSDFAYRMQKPFFPFPKEQWMGFMYGFLGLFKLLVIVFNVTPWIALLVMGG